MNFPEFSVYMRKLIDTYGDKAYPKPRVDAIFQMVKDISGSEFSAIVDGLILDNQFAPAPEKIRMVAQSALVRAGHSRRLEMQKEHGRCKWCDNLGLLRIIRIGDDQKTSSYYSARCPHCRSAQLLNLSTSIPIWDESFVSKFKIVPICDSVSA